MTPSDEVFELRRTARDVIAISSLPSIWAHYNVNQIAESLIETVFRSLILDFAYIGLNGGNEKTRTAYSHQGFLKAADLDRLHQELSPWLETSSPVVGTKSIKNPFGGGNLQVQFTPIGFNFKNGYLITGALRTQFPTEPDRLILNIASNQTNVVIETKWSQAEAQRLLQMAEDKEQMLKDATIRAELAKAEAINANKLKSSFLANMSHEIRTPLGAILGFTDVLKSPTLHSSERNQYLDIITRNGQSLAKIIDDILDLSKIEAGKLEMDSLPLSIIDVCREVVTTFSEIASGKGIFLTFDGSQLPSFEICSDAARVRQVLVNLVGNAVKFTSEGSVSLGGHFAKDETGSVRVTLTVTDTGAGMSKATSQNLFKPFIQGDNTTTRKFGGTGLGLALSKKLGLALGGDVTLAQCEVNKGCTFNFEFVAKTAAVTQANSNEGNPTVAATRKLLSGYKVLVVDDAPDNRLYMQVVLTQQGAELDFAEDGEDAVSKSLGGEFDAVLMDIQMPKLDGYGALAKLREHNFDKPVFALTAHAMKEERDRAINAGFVDHISKPINTHLLVQSILTHARRL